MTRTRLRSVVALASAILLGCGLGPAGASNPSEADATASRALEWRRVDDPVVLRPNTATLDVGCAPTGVACVAVGHRYDQDGTRVPVAQRWDGTTWSAETLPPDGAASLAQVDCSTPVDCVALETHERGSRPTRRIAVRSAAGWRWITWTVPRPRLEVDLVTCASSTWCVVAGSVGNLAVFDGTAVRPFPSAPDFIESISCPVVDHCMALGIAELLEWDGARWTSVEQDDGDLTTIDCWAREHCLALGTSYSSDAPAAFLRSPGATWRQLPPPAGRGQLDETLDVACASDGTCHVLLRIGQDEPSSRLLSWAAGAWRAYDVSPPPGQVTGLACRTGECVIVDSAYSIVDSDEPSTSSALHGLGGQWQRRPMVNPLGLPPDTVPLETTCPVRGWCLALGLDGNDDEYVTRRTGGQWRRLPAALAVQRDLDCWRRSACVVAGSDGTRPRAARLLRGRWRVTPAIPSRWMVSGTITGVGCVGSRCAYSGIYEARGRAGWGTFVAVRDRGTWKPERVGPLVPYENWISARPSMDCPTDGPCVVVFSSSDTRGANGTIPVSFEAVLRGGRWRTAVIGKGFSLFEIDCSDARHCIAGGEEGRPGLVMSRSADGAWRTVSVATRNAAFYSVSCPSARECHVAGIGSKVVHLTRTGESWRARRSGPRDMTDIACPGRRWCLTFGPDSTWVGS